MNHNTFAKDKAHTSNSLAVAGLVILPFLLGSCSGSSSPIDSLVAEANASVGVTVTQDWPGTATVKWTTTTPTQNTVFFGADASNWQGSVQETAPTKNHNVVLEGLNFESAYQVALSDSDSADASDVVASFYVDDVVQGEADISGERKAWHPITLSFNGPFANESDSAPNPFLDYRLEVIFRGPSGQAVRVPGFFDGDGQGGGSGSVYSVRFAPEEGGLWTYAASFREGNDIAVSTDLMEGNPIGPDSAGGLFAVLDRDASAPGFYKYGVLECNGEHYLKFREGPYFLKGGTDSPENFLGYRGFDNTFDQPGGAPTSSMPDGVHRFGPHIGDFGPDGLGDENDPFWKSADTGYDSRGIVGAVNYLSSVGVNSVYFLPMNLGGDGRETYPFISPTSSHNAKTHYDISKLKQWNDLFIHCQKKSVMLHFVLGETEIQNEQWLDAGKLGVERKLFYREMISRFGHALAVKWNLCEENDFKTAQIEEFADYISELDAFHHPIAFHTHLLGSSGNYSSYDAILDNQHIGSASLQGQLKDAGDQVELWREKSAAAGHKWVVESDEQAPASLGLTDYNADQLRKETLYDVYFSGGNIEWYAGYHPLPLGGDMRMEDFRTREDMWKSMYTARQFLEKLPFWQMEPADHLITGESSSYGGAEVFGIEDKVYAIYFPNASDTGQIDLTAATGSFTARWFDPRKGEFAGRFPLQAGGVQTLENPPYEVSEDWVLLLRH